MSNYQAGQLVLSQLIGCPLGGGIVGWLLDRWFGTQPWLMLVMLFLGFAGRHLQRHSDFKQRLEQSSGRG